MDVQLILVGNTHEADNGSDMQQYYSLSFVVFWKDITAVLRSLVANICSGHVLNLAKDFRTPTQTVKRLHDVD